MSKRSYAAGGVLWRTGSSGVVEVGLVHRPRYDDWSLPKGKTERGETLLATAVREIGEETGQQVRIGRHLTSVSYETNNHTHKHVEYWSARSVGGDFAPNEEVDELAWFSIADARKKLSYRLDVTVVDEFAALPADLHTMIVVRHAQAGRKSQYKGDDRLRPLDKTGRAQAEALVGQLLPFGPTALHAAERIRCEQTLAPTAVEAALEVQPEPTLSEEAYRDDPKAARRRISQIIGETGIHVVCSQGKVIPSLMSRIADEAGLQLPPADNRKASMWVLSFTGGVLVHADHQDSPLPIRMD
ncbi:NUDIX hydrolase [Williamsia sterculiae]|uniref:8-oxo-dGTP diphosphatase n=1 Tax=Williamsia sterculiae TaxID=1344003 RepID=A0A1N7G4P3_9NOCA|nr:NUDIX hydrolase [Williamsia sterculiae]SIS07567.1 8-oxo-dGTP diphosphatase [Williamsia sterculiae]